MTPVRQVVIGIGNLDRGDDGAGRFALRQLRGRVAADVRLIEETGEATALLAAVEGAAAAYFLDACSSGAPPGTLHRFDLARAPWPGFLLSRAPHGLGLAEALGLARALALLPARCVVYAIEGASFALGAPLSAPVRAQIEPLVARLAAEIGSDRPALAASAHGRRAP